VPQTSSLISNGGNWSTERTPGSFTEVAENPPRLTSQRLAVIPGHPRRRIPCQLACVPLKLGEVVERIGAYPVKQCQRLTPVAS